MKSENHKRPLVAVANWKLHKNVIESVEYAQVLSKKNLQSSGVRVLIAPSFTSLEAVGRHLGAGMGLAAQDLYWEKEGAYTGEVSAAQLVDVGCLAVLIGHSERRRHFSETNETVSRKIRAALHHGLRPILCIGETEEERKSGQASSVLETQLKEGLHQIEDQQAESIIVAYEPVWAIGTGRVATTDQIAESHDLIRKRLSVIFLKGAEAIPILYGGSVTPENVSEIATVAELDGVLVGSASLSVDKFVTIVETLAGRLKRA